MANPGQSLSEPAIYPGVGQVDAFQIVGPGGNVIQATTIGGLTYGTGITLDNLIAKASGTQANSTQLLNAYGFPVTMARIKTVVSSGDGILLPPSVAGYQIAILNDAAVNAANIWPAVGDQINSQGVNNSFSLAIGTPTIFYCFTAGLWRTK